MRKRTHKLKAMKAEVLAAVASSSSVKEAAAKVGVSESMFHRWVSSNKVPRPGDDVAQTPNPPERVTGKEDSADVAGILAEFSIDRLLRGPRPGTVDPEADKRWLQGRRYVLHLADRNGFDPRPLLTMSRAAIERWRAERLAWLTLHLDTHRIKAEIGD